MDFNSIIQGAKNFLFPQQKIVSPLPEGYNPQNEEAYSAIKQYRPQYKGDYAQTNRILQAHKLEDLIPEYKKPNPVAGVAHTVAKVAQPVTDTVHRVLGANTGPRVIPRGTDLAMNYIRSKTPNAPEDLGEYYPALKDPEFVRGVNEADNMRQGLANLLLLQGFQESTLGRGSSNIFGVKPGGNVSQFGSPSEALQYQLSKNVLGGGGNPNMNVLNEEDRSPLNTDRIKRLYQSYDPPGAYIDSLLEILSQ